MTERNAKPAVTKYTSEQKFDFLRDAHGHIHAAQRSLFGARSGLFFLYLVGCGSAAAVLYNTAQGLLDGQDPELMRELKMRLILAVSIGWSFLTLVFIFTDHKMKNVFEKNIDKISAIDREVGLAETNALGSIGESAPRSWRTVSNAMDAFDVGYGLWAFLFTSIGGVTLYALAQAAGSSL